MPSSEQINELLIQVARAADLTIKPFKHSVFDKSKIKSTKNKEDLNVESFSDLIFRIESRSPEGVRHPDKDLELEIYRSGSEINIMLSWCEGDEKPILWQGKHFFWMNGITGEPCSSPKNGKNFETLARRIRASFAIFLD